MPDMFAQHVAILTPMQIEADAVARGLEVPPAWPQRPMAFERNGLSIIMHVIGIGAHHLPQFDEKPRAIILAGLATEIAGILRVGSVVVGYGATLATRLPYPRESFLSDRRLLTPSDKYCASYCTGDGAADQESGPVEAYAVKHGIPFMNLRAISERQQDTVDPQILQMIDEFGNLKTRAARKILAQRPELRKQWMRWRRDSHIALYALAAAIAAVVDEMAASSPAPRAD
jgi:hypothetical protein